MRIAILTVVIGLLAAAPAHACFEAVQASAQDGTTDLAAAVAPGASEAFAMEMKKSAKPPHKKHHRKPKEKVEYMRAVPWK